MRIFKKQFPLCFCVILFFVQVLEVAHAEEPDCEVIHCLVCHANMDEFWGRVKMKYALATRVLSSHVTKQFGNLQCEKAPTLETGQPLSCNPLLKKRTPTLCARPIFVTFQAI